MEINMNNHYVKRKAYPCSIKSSVSVDWHNSVILHYSVYMHAPNTITELSILQNYQYVIRKKCIRNCCLLKFNVENESVICGNTQWICINDIQIKLSLSVL